MYALPFAFPCPSSRSSLKHASFFTVNLQLLSKYRTWIVQIWHIDSYTHPLCYFISAGCERIPQTVIFLFHSHPSFALIALQQENIFFICQYHCSDTWRDTIHQWVVRTTVHSTCIYGCQICPPLFLRFCANENYVSELMARLGKCKFTSILRKFANRAG